MKVNNLIQNKKIKKNYASHFSYKECYKFALSKDPYQIEPRACNYHHLTAEIL